MRSETSEAVSGVCVSHRIKEAIILKRYLLILFFIIPAVASAMDVKSDYDRDVNLSILRTFQFVDRSPRHPKSADELTEKRMRNAIRDSFAAVGLQETTEAPDVMLVYYSSVDHKKRIVASGHGRPGWWGGMQSAWVENSMDGTAVVDLLDAQTGELIWRGRVTGAITLNNADQRTKDGMRKLAAAFSKDRDKQYRRKK